MRILHLFNSFERGGTELQTVRLIRELCARGMEVHVASQCSHGPLRHAVERLNIASIRSFPLVAFARASTVNQVLRFASHLRNLRIDVLQTHDFYTNVFGLPAGALAGTPVRIGSKRETGMLDRARCRAELLSFRFADAVLANCVAARVTLQAGGISPLRIITIHNGVDVTQYSPRVVRPWVLARLQLTRLAGRPLVVMVSNLRHELKDHPALLRAARLVLAQRPDCAFIIAGEGGLLKNMRLQAAALGIADSVHFVGHFADISRLVTTADVCVLTSLSEGFPNAILEYMAGAKPVVATDVGGIGEAVLDGVTGYLVAPGDSSSMARRILDLLADPELARRMGERGRRRAECCFRVEAQVERTCALYALLLERRSWWRSARGSGTPGTACVTGSAR